MPEEGKGEISGLDLSSLLGNRDILERLRQTASTLGLGDKLEDAVNKVQGASDPKPPASPIAEKNSVTDIPQPLQNFLSDPALIGTLSALMSAMNSEGPECLFLKSLKPLLRPERGEKVDRAITLLKTVQALEAVQQSKTAGVNSNPLSELGKLLNI